LLTDPAGNKFLACHNFSADQPASAVHIYASSAGSAIADLLSSSFRQVFSAH